MNKVVYSLFDGSGIMGLPWAEAGYQVYCFNADEANHGSYVVKMKHENLHYVNVWIDESFSNFISFSDIPSPDIIFAFPDCTFSAGSGSKHERTDKDIEPLIQSCELVKSLGNRFNCPWMIENPVGSLSTKWRTPQAYFHPYEYGGFLDKSEGSYHPKMPVCDGYTKKTCIWHGNGFVMPLKKPGPVNIGLFWGWKYLGGNSPKTKQLRSLTPRGFARAVLASNSNK